ncbi:MAG TPA: ABC transporter substrate-binding protein [Chloroflexota bacterium]|nr:ABC transporter substrate-binding protein [Chloroflexota bacterium]
MGVSRRRLLAAAGAGSGGALMVACGAAATGTGGNKVEPLAAVSFGQPTEITFLHSLSSTLTKAVDDMVAKFNSSNDKKITVKTEFVTGSYAGLFQKNQVLLQGGTPADLSVAYESHVAEYMRGGWNIDLEPYIKDKNLGLSKESLEDVFANYLEGQRYPQYDNKLLSWPFAKSMLLMTVNDELLSRSGVTAVPKTWTEFQAAIQKMSRGDASLIIDKTDMAASELNQDPTRKRTYGWANYPNASTIYAWAYSRGGTILDPQTKQVKWNDPAFLESFQFTEDNFKRQYAYNPPRQPGSDYDFVSNRYAFIMQSTTSRPFIRSVMKANGRDSLPWRLAMIPQKDAAKPASVAYGPNVALFKTSPVKQAAAWAFVKWWSEKEQDVEWSITSNYMPVRKSSAETPRLKGYWEKDDPQGKQAFELLKYAKPEPNTRGTDPIRKVIEDALLSVMEGKKSSKAALEAATREANQLLAQA